MKSSKMIYLFPVRVIIEHYDTIKFFLNLIYDKESYCYLYVILGCPKNVFLLHTRLLQRCIFIQTWNLMSNVVIVILIEQNGSYVIR